MQRAVYVDIRFRVEHNTVDAETTTKFIQEFVMGKFSFIQESVPLVNNGFAQLLPDETRRLTRSDRPVQDGEEG